LWKTSDLFIILKENHRHPIHYFIMVGKKTRKIVFNFKYIKIVHNFLGTSEKTPLIGFDTPEGFFINSSLHFYLFFCLEPSQNLKQPY
jgi:hypothetical protein